MQNAPAALAEIIPPDITVRGTVRVCVCVCVWGGGGYHDKRKGLSKVIQVVFSNV